MVLPVPDGPTMAVIPPAGSSRGRGGPRGCRRRCRSGTTRRGRPTAAGTADQEGDGGWRRTGLGSTGSVCTSRSRTDGGKPRLGWLTPLTSAVIGSPSRSRYSRKAISDDTGSVPLAA